MRGFQTRETRMALRELVLVVLAGVASFLFINHENLYFSGPFVLSNAPIEAYFLATIVLYLFLRLVIIAAEMRVPRTHAALVRCPECGQWLDDPTGAGRDAHHRVELTPKPTEKEILSAVALRKAVDTARLATKSSKPVPREDLMTPPTNPESVSSRDLIAALNDPDLLERLRHSPQPPKGPQVKR